MDEEVADYHTTNIAFVFDGGIIAAADGRTSIKSDELSHLPDRIKGTSTVKIRKLKPFLHGMAGKKAKSELGLYVHDDLCKRYAESHGETIAMKTVAEQVGKVAFQGSNSNGAAEAIISGYEGGVAKIYHVRHDGTVEGPQDKAGTGTGYKFGRVILEKEHEKRLTVKEAIALARRTIIYSAIRDLQTGGEMTVLYMDPTGRVRRQSYEIEMSVDLESAIKGQQELERRWNNNEFTIARLVESVEEFID